jgi:hypothetical protein
MAEQWSFQSVVTYFVRDGDLSAGKKEFHARTYQRLVEEGYISKEHGEPPEWIQAATGSWEYKNCTWAHCICNVLVALNVDVEDDPLEAPFEFLGAKSIFVDEEEEAEHRHEQEAWDALTEDERMEALQDCVKALESP